MVVNAAYFLTGQEVPEQADVQFVDPFYPSFYGFIRDPDYWKTTDIYPEDFDLGETPHLPDPPGSPEWNFRPTPPADAQSSAGRRFRHHERIALVGVKR
jgi:hypothetical protein